MPGFACPITSWWERPRARVPVERASYLPEMYPTNRDAPPVFQRPVRESGSSGVALVARSLPAFAQSNPRRIVRSARRMGWNSPLRRRNPPRPCRPAEYRRRAKPRRAAAFAVQNRQGQREAYSILVLTEARDRLKAEARLCLRRDRDIPRPAPKTISLLLSAHYVPRSGFAPIPAAPAPRSSAGPALVS